MPRARSRLMASPSPRALARARERGVQLHERVEHHAQLVAGDAHARVLHAHQHPVAGRVGAHGHPPARLGELDRVAQQVEHHLLHLVAVGAHAQLRRAVGRRGRVGEREAARPHLRRHERLARGQHLVERHVGQLVVHGARLHARVVEHPVDEARAGAAARAGRAPSRRAWSAVTGPWMPIAISSA
jgi:hypothetical protein